MNLTLTPAAQKFIRRMIRFNGAAGGGFRLTVTAGGCSGLAPEFEVEAAPRSGDAVLEYGDIRLFLPAESRLLLDGVTVDFVETATQVGLVFHDPKSANCACKSPELAAAGPAAGDSHP
jgi:iron-sulfur cluster assembly accessory protein